MRDTVHSKPNDKVVPLVLLISENNLLLLLEKHSVPVLSCPVQVSAPAVFVVDCEGKKCR